MIAHYDIRYLPLMLITIWYASLTCQVAAMCDEGFSPFIVVPQVVLALALLAVFFRFAVRKRTFLTFSGVVWIVLALIGLIFPLGIVLIFGMPY
jgi:hypothetical protein